MIQELRRSRLTGSLAIWKGLSRMVARGSNRSAIGRCRRGRLGLAGLCWVIEWVLCGCDGGLEGERSVGIP